MKTKTALSEAKMVIIVQDREDDIYEQFASIHANYVSDKDYYHWFAIRAKKIIFHYISNRQTL